MERRWVSPPLNSITISTPAFIDERQKLLARMKAWSVVLKKWLFLLTGVFLSNDV
jgi:hypothetical protein